MMAINTDYCVYSLGGVYIYNISEPDSELAEVKIIVNPYPSTFLDFMDRIHNAFIQWGCEHGYNWIARFQLIELTRLTTDGIICNYVADPPLTRNDWEHNWTVLYTQMTSAIGNDIPISLTVNCLSLQILGNRQPELISDIPPIHSSTNQDDN